MSFRLFKTHAPKKSAISRTAEREFEREVKKLETLDENVKKIYKDTKRCIEAQTAQSKCEVKMSEDLHSSVLCKEDEALRQVVESWTQATQHLEGLGNELNASSQKVIMEPMKKFGVIFPSVQASIKKREQSLQEYNKCKAKLDKYVDRERTGPNIVKLDSCKRALTAAKEDYDSHNTNLMEDMPKLYEGRIDYLMPSFQALIHSQVKYYTESHKTYSDLAAKLETQTGHCSDSSDEFNQRMQQKLGEIRALSITVDD